jgi:CheY-like chemotaxis protein
MTAETQAHIFEPFFTTKEAGKGTGLGLATVYGIIKQAGGSIFVYSEPNCGTTFKILFPRAEAISAVEPGPEEPGPRGELETVLLVEDEDTVRKLVGNMLRERGYGVMEAANGKEALQVMAQHGAGISIVLTDVVMPKMNGPQLIAALRETYRELKVVYMSGYTDRTVPLEEQARTAFIQKPFTPNQLQQKIRAIVSAP